MCCAFSHGYRLCTFVELPAQAQEALLPLGPSLHSTLVLLILSEESPSSRMISPTHNIANA